VQKDGMPRAWMGYHRCSCYILAPQFPQKVAAASRGERLVRGVPTAGRYRWILIEKRKQEQDMG